MSEHEALVALREAGGVYTYLLQATEACRMAHAAIPQLEALLAERAELVAVIAGLVDLTESTDSFCELCERHAPKSDDGEITGPVPHHFACLEGRARALLAKLEGGADE